MGEGRDEGEGGRGEKRQCKGAKVEKWKGLLGGWLARVWLARGCDAALRRASMGRVSTAC